MTDEGQHGASAEPRQHHHVPASFLAGFTQEGTKSGTLHVWDLVDGRGWQSTPEKTARIRDFYRVEKPGDAPNRVERGLGIAETDAAPILKSLIETRRLPTREDLGVLLVFVALLETRSTGLRRDMIDVTERRTLAWLREICEDEKRWAEMTEKVQSSGYDMSRGPDRLGMLEAVTKPRIRITSPQDLQVSWVGRMFQVLVPLLLQRHWFLLTSPPQRPIQFIASDRPLSLVWTYDDNAERPPQLDDRLTDAVIPLSSECALLGRFEPETPSFTPDDAAAINTRTIVRADRYLYSAHREFEALHGEGEIVVARGLKRVPRPAPESAAPDS